MLDDDKSSLAHGDIRRSFSRAAESYDRFAVLQREVDSRLASQLSFLMLMPDVILDLGAGTGQAARHLKRKYKKAKLLLIDLAPGMLNQARARRRWLAREMYVCADAAKLAIRSASVDLIYSNLMFQWCSDLEMVFRECRRVLRPNGLLVFSTLGPNTLCELRAAWAGVDDAPHVNVFLDMHDVGDKLIAAGYESPVLEREDMIMTYPEVKAVMRDLQGIGAHNSHSNRHRGLTGKSAFASVVAAYEQYRNKGILPASYEVVYGHAWAPSAIDRPQDGSTVAQFPLHKLTRRPT